MLSAALDQYRRQPLQFLVGFIERFLQAVRLESKAGYVSHGLSDALLNVVHLLIQDGKLGSGGGDFGDVIAQQIDRSSNSSRAIARRQQSSSCALDPIEQSCSSF